DLVGAAVGVRTQGDPEAPHYEPRAPDPLPRPPAYRAALARAGNPYGQSDAEGANDPSTSDSNAISEPGATSPEGSDAPNTSGTQGSSAGSSPDGTNTAGTTTGGMSTTGRTNGSARPPSAPRAGVQVRLSAASAEVVRGRAIELEGTIEDEHGAAAASMRVEVLLRGRGERLLGVAVTDAEGRFFGAFGVPHDLAVGDYRLVVRTPGDARHLPAELE
ncbi:MAG: carboxypeptidase regulatory-like domain-containing protein, partial [Myxococcales bacterium]|nr:carboxypeptidase regulatory-like domain-containing protein [Myxococcales bacterium]